MRIRFETTMEDLLAFHRFHYANSPAWKAQVWKQQLLMPVWLLVIVLLAVVVLRGDAGDIDFLILIPFGLIAFVASVAWIGLAGMWLNRCLERNVRKLLAEGSNRTLLGWREMELVDNRLLLKTEYIDSRISLRAIDKIVGNEGYTFIYIASTSAYVIPMQRWPEAEYREFVGELRQAWENTEQAGENRESLADADTIMIRRGPPGTK